MSVIVSVNTSMSVSMNVSVSMSTSVRMSVSVSVPAGAGHRCCPLAPGDRWGLGRARAPPQGSCPQPPPIAPPPPVPGSNKDLWTRGRPLPSARELKNKELIKNFII